MLHKVAEQWGAKLSPYTPAILRVITGIIFIYAGWAKLGMGNAAVAGFFSSVGIPAPAFFAFLVTWIELLGGIALVVGLWTRVAAKLLAIIMIVATIIAWSGKGFGDAQLPLIMFASCFTLFCLGSGKYSVDR